VFEKSREEMEKETNLLSKKRLEMEQSREEIEKEANLLRKKKLEMEQSREDREIMYGYKQYVSNEKGIFSFTSN